MIYKIMKNKNNFDKQEKEEDQFFIPTQNCPLCGKIISAMPGTKDAICQNCGYKDPCCE